MNPEVKQAMIKFMDERFFCVISTVGADARPESAFVAYVSNDAHEIMIGTSNLSRKFKNLTQNKSVAIVIADLTGEVQYEGQVELLTTQAYEALLHEGKVKKLSGFDKYRNDPTQVYLKITPTWIRFTVHGEADQITEFTEFA